MRIWDIIDKTYPGVEVTQHTEKAVNLAQPGVRFSFSVAARLILATASLCSISVPYRTSYGAEAAMHTPKKAPVRTPRGKIADFSVDTAHAVSPRRLAATFENYFSPAEDEAEYDGEYFFG